MLWCASWEEPGTCYEPHPFPLAWEEGGPRLQKLSLNKTHFLWIAQNLSDVASKSTCWESCQKHSIWMGGKESARIRTQGFEREIFKLCKVQITTLPQPWHIPSFMPMHGLLGFQTSLDCFSHTHTQKPWQVDDTELLFKDHLRFVWHSVENVILASVHVRCLWEDKRYRDSNE